MKKMILLLAVVFSMQTSNAQNNTYEDNLKNYVDNTIGIRAVQILEFEALENQVPQEYRADFKRRYTTLIENYSAEVFAVYNEFYENEKDLVNNVVNTNRSNNSSNPLPVLNTNAVMQTYLSAFQTTYNTNKQALLSKYVIL